MFRVAMFAIVAAGVTLSSTQAQAGIFFRRGGCSGGQCCAGGQCHVAMPPAPTASVAKPADEAVAKAAQESQERSASPSTEATADASSPNAAGEGTAAQGYVRRIGFRRLGGIRLLGRWR